MPAGVYNIAVEQGAGYSVTFIYKDANNNPINITGWRAKMQVKVSATSNTTLLSLDSLNNDIVINGLAGSIVVNISGAQTQSFSTASALYLYDIKLYPTSAEPIRLVEGTFSVVSGITN